MSTKQTYLLKFKRGDKVYILENSRTSIRRSPYQVTGIIITHKSKIMVHFVVEAIGYPDHYYTVLSENCFASIEEGEASLQKKNSDENEEAV